VISSLVAIGIVAIYGGGIATGYFAGLRPEIWQLRNARKGFHDTYADKVTQLRGRAEYELLSTIYGSETLKDVFERKAAQDAGSRRLTDSDRTQIEKEIERITAGLHEVTEPRKLFDGVCSDYTAQAGALESFVNSLLGMSLIVLVVTVGLATTPDSYAIAWSFVGVFVFVLTFGPVINRWQAYTKIRDRRIDNESKLVQAVDERILMPPASAAEAPPAVPASAPGLPAAPPPAGATFSTTPVDTSDSTASPSSTSIGASQP